jgi:predicted porin
MVRAGRLLQVKETAMSAGKWMIRTAFSFALGILSVEANAQSSVQLYGSIDEGVTYVTNEGGGHNVVVGPVAVPDYWGLRGAEDLGGGYQAFFKLQSGFTSNNGANLISTDMFSWLSFVGLTTPYGSVSLGRQFDLTNDALTPSSNGVLQYSYFLFHPGNVDDAALTSVDNSIKYTTPSIGGLALSAMYAMADSTTQPGRVLAFDAIYDQGPLRVGAVYSSWHDKEINLEAKLGYTSFLGESLRGGASFIARSADIAGVSARYQGAGVVGLHGMFTHVAIDATTGESGSMNTVEAGVDFRTTPFNTITLGGFYSSLTGTRYQEAAIGDLYALSKSTIVYAQASYQHASGAGNAGMALLQPSSASGQGAFRVGMHHFF